MYVLWQRDDSKSMPFGLARYGTKGEAKLALEKAFGVALRGAEGKGTKLPVMSARRDSYIYQGVTISIEEL